MAGFLVAKLGAAVCGCVATGLVFGGQIIVYFAQSLEGGAAGNLPLMVSTRSTSGAAPPSDCQRLPLAPLKTRLSRV